MSAISDMLRTKLTPIKKCIVYSSANSSIPGIGELAAAELAAMQARIEKLEKVKNAAQKLVNLRGVTHGTWVVEELEAALRDVK